MPNTPKRPDVEGIEALTATHRMMPVTINGKAYVVRFPPETASQTPLSFDEQIFHAMADRIEALEARLEKLEAVVKAARGRDKYHPRSSGETKIIAAIAALGDGDG